MPGVPLIDLGAQYRGIRPEIDAAIQSVLDRGQFILGTEVASLEREIAAYCGSRFAVGVASGTDALELALRACGIRPGDEVITTSFSFFATAEAVIAVGAVPVFVDIDPETYNLDPRAVERAVGPKTKAILPVHLYGHTADMKALLALARSKNLKVVEDCAQAIGAAADGKRAGSFGDAGAFSFFPSKNLGGYGDGGMVVTDDEKLAESVRLLRAHGSREKYHHIEMGTNSRLDELQAAILRVKLKHLDAWNAARRTAAAAYGKGIRSAGLNDVALPVERPGCTHVYHLFCVRSRQRAAIQQALTQAGIAWQVAYPGTLPSQPALSYLASAKQRFPQAERAAQEVLALPMYAELPQSAVDAVVAAISQAPAPSKAQPSRR